MHRERTSPEEHMCYSYKYTGNHSCEIPVVQSPKYIAVLHTLCIQSVVPHHDNANPDLINASYETF